MYRDKGSINLAEISSMYEMTVGGKVAIIEDREKPRFEKMVDVHTGFLFTDKDGMPLIAMHWEHRRTLQKN